MCTFIITYYSHFIAEEPEEHKVRVSPLVNGGMENLTQTRSPLWRAKLYAGKAELLGGYFQLVLIVSS